jgi:DNA-binding NarL/FixJ family response regulator
MVDYYPKQVRPTYPQYFLFGGSMSDRRRRAEISERVTNQASRLGDMSAMVRIMHPLDMTTVNPLQPRRRLLADLCRLVGESVGAGRVQRSADRSNDALSRRQDQTLQHLLEGDNEKQVARKLSLSRHTVHVYVKALYRRYGVSSRAELLAKHLHR